MQAIRSSIISRLFSLVTGLIFLNMSLIMAEVSALKLDRDKELFGNIAKMISGCSSEEEADGVQGLSDEDSSLEEINLIFDNQLDLSLSLVIDSNHKLSLQNQGVPRFGNYEIYCPPPEA
ncbi:MAG TPA: hypothetical protein VK666_30850 [Chryseolinea sp.]|nr:hypothetical protein [Chryseolinea sp.]